jgi:hypothetical protein
MKDKGNDGGGVSTVVRGGDGRGEEAEDDDGESLMDRRKACCLPILARLLHPTQL